MLVEKLSSQDKRLIDVLRHSTGSSGESDFFTGTYVSCDTFLRFWEEAKTHWAQVFDDTLIFKKNIRTKVEDDDLYYNLRELSYTDKYKTLVDKIITTVNKENPDLEITIENHWPYSYHFNQFARAYLFDTELWIRNSYSGPTFSINMPNGATYKFTDGCKIMKILGKLAKLIDNEAYEAYEEIRLAHSRIMNEAVIDATLCVSIHPLDYMTASYNNNDWRSCMCWEDGEYRRGVIEMMNSPCVVVAYLESKRQKMSFYEGYNTPKLTWNSKKWREFFIVTPEIISGIKGYPYWNKEIERHALDMIKDLFSSIYPQYKNNTTLIEYKSEEKYCDEENNVFLSVSMDCGPAMYNDFYGDNTYIAYIPEETRAKSIVSVFYSGKSECVCCGRTPHHDWIEFESEGDLICDNCVEHFSCCKCGDAIISDEDLIEFNDRYYCRYCYENLPTCDYCDAIVDEDNDVSLIFTLGTNKKQEKNTNSEQLVPVVLHNLFDNHERPRKLCVCKDCASRVFVDGVDELYRSHHSYSDWFNYLPIVTIEKMTDYGLSGIEEKELVDLKERIIKGNDIDISEETKLATFPW